MRLIDRARGWVPLLRAAAAGLAIACILALVAAPAAGGQLSSSGGSGRVAATSIAADQPGAPHAPQPPSDGCAMGDASCAPSAAHLEQPAPRPAADAPLGGGAEERRPPGQLPGGSRALLPRVALGVIRV